MISINKLKAKLSICVSNSLFMVVNKQTQCKHIERETHQVELMIYIWCHRPQCMCMCVCVCVCACGGGWGVYMDEEENWSFLCDDDGDDDKDGDLK